MRLNRLGMLTVGIIFFIAGCGGGGGGGPKPTVAPTASATETASPLPSATASATPRATASATPSPSPTAVPSGTATNSATTANAPGLVISGKTVLVYVPQASNGKAAPNVEEVTVETASGVNTSNTPPPKLITVGSSSGGPNSCAASGVSGVVVCSDYGVANIEVIPPSGSPVIVPNPSNPVANDYGSGDCVGCGAAVDDLMHWGIIASGAGWNTSPSNTIGGYTILNLSNNSIVETISKLNEPVSAQFGYDPINHRILSPNYSVNPSQNFASSPPHFQIIALTGAGAPNIYDLANDHSFFNQSSHNCTDSGGASHPADILPDSGAIDTQTDIAYASFRNPTACAVASGGKPLADIGIFDLKQATFTPGTSTSTGTWDSTGKQIQTLAELPNVLGVGITGISVLSGAHVALLADQSGTNGFGALSLPPTSGTGIPTIPDWVGGVMPNDPSGTPWTMTGSPNSLITYMSPNTGRPMGVIVNGSHTYLAVIDLTNMLNPASRVGGSAHILPTTLPTTSPPIVRFVKAK
jgi:hypothetical protein